jgi:hypothetical protein
MPAAMHAPEPGRIVRGSGVLFSGQGGLFASPANDDPAITGLTEVWSSRIISVGCQIQQDKSSTSD